MIAVGQGRGEMLMLGRSPWEGIIWERPEPDCVISSVTKHLASMSTNLGLIPSNKKLVAKRPKEANLTNCSI